MAYPSLGRSGCTVLAANHLLLFLQITLHFCSHTLVDMVMASRNRSRCCNEFSSRSTVTKHALPVPLTCQYQTGIV